MILPLYVLAALVVVIYVLLFRRVLRYFLKEDELLLIFLLPLAVFVLGFILRLSGDQNLVDLGFFFTDSATFFVTLVFTLALILGQVKYWKV